MANSSREYMMRCPNCDRTEIDFHVSCAGCGYLANGRSWLQLAQVNFLLAEMATWLEVPQYWLNPLQKRYERQKRAIETELGLRPPPPDEVETIALQAELQKLHALRNVLPEWAERSWVETAVLQTVLRETAVRTQQIQERLIDAPSLELPDKFPIKRLIQKLEEKRFLLETIQRLHQNRQVEQKAYQSAITRLMAEVTELEIEAGLRERPKPTLVAPMHTTDLRRAQTETTEPAPKRPLSLLWTWDRMWETLLSERTLQTILFLGAMLLFAAGVSWVAWNWGMFLPAVQVAFLGGFTAVFYLLGWYVQFKLGLHGSGIALSAVGALLVPLDFYAFYLSGGFPPHTWPTVWLVASAVCLLAYLLTVWLLQAEFFAYLVGIALGSLVVAAMNLFGISDVWWQVGVAATALGFAVFSIQYSVFTVQSFVFLLFTRALGRLALTAVAPLLFISLGYGFIVGMPDHTFYLAMAVSWWLGGLTLTRMTHQYRLQTVVWADALIFPVAIWLTVGWLTRVSAVSMTWAALGWAILAPVYLLVSHRLKTEIEESQIVWRVGSGLVVISAVLALGSTQTLSVVHPLLAITMLLAAGLAGQPRYLWGMSLFLAMGAAAWQGERGATLAELSLPWALLAVLHVVAAVQVDSRQPMADGRKRQAVVGSPWSAVLHQMAAILAGLAMLPPLVLWQRPLLTYAMGNWIGMSGWLAYLTYQRPARSSRLFHWSAALAVAPWVWLWWGENGSLSVVYALVAWGLLAVGLWVRRWGWGYGRAWEVAAHLVNGTAVLAGLFYFEQSRFAGVLLLIAVFYFVAARLLHQRNWSFVGGTVFPVAVLLGLNSLGLSMTFSQPVLAIIALGYVVTGAGLERYGVSGRFLNPLYTLAWVVVVFAIMLGILQAGLWWESHEVLKIALGLILLGMTTAVYSWLRQVNTRGHDTIWLLTAGGGLVIKVYSHGSGRSAAMIALLAVGYIVTERVLYWVASRRVSKFASLQIGKWSATKSRNHSVPVHLFIRKAWRLYRRPLQIAGWVLSVVAIGAAIGRNLILLGGGTERQTWAIVALWLVIGLYGFAAWAYGKPRFLWFASLVAIVPWTLLTDLGWYVLPQPEWQWHCLSWVVLGYGLLVIGKNLRGFETLAGLAVPEKVAHGLVPVALFMGMLLVPVSVWSVGVAVLFYGTAVYFDQEQQAGKWANHLVALSPIHPFTCSSVQLAVSSNPRFLCPMLALIPIWAVYWLLWWLPDASLTAIGLLVLAFALPMLVGGQWVRRFELQYALPFYLVAYTTAVIALFLVGGERPFLILVLLLNTALAVLSVWLFQEPLWWYPATLLLPWAAVLLAAEANIPANRHGWILTGVGALYLVGAWLLRRFKLSRYETPLLAMMFLVVLIGLPFSSQDTWGVMLGYSLAAAVYAVAALWLQMPLLFHLAMILTLWPYATAVFQLAIPSPWGKLAFGPGILLASGLAGYLDKTRPREKTAAGEAGFPWYNPERWLVAVGQLLTHWWALSAYGVACMGILFTSGELVEGHWQAILIMGMGTAVFAWLMFRFRLRGWLLATLVWGQLTVFTLFNWGQWVDTPGQFALLFMPVMWGTAALGLWIERVQQEGSPFISLHAFWFGWSRPFYLLLTANLVISQLLALIDGFFDSYAGVVVTLCNALLVALLATVWHSPWLAYGSLIGGWVALGLAGEVYGFESFTWPVAMALLTMVYGVPGYSLKYYRTEINTEQYRWVGVWERPLRLSGLALSGLATLLAWASGPGIFSMVLRVVWGGGGLRPFELPAAQMMILVLGILGLLYLLVAFVEQKRRVGYASLLALLSAWGLWALLIQGQQELQLYALPAGTYLLGIAWVEWQVGNQALARWIDRAALLLLFGSALWQSFGVWGSLYALLMVVEGVLLVWLGSLRRLRRLLYGGAVGVVTAVVSQLLEPLFALDTVALLLLGAFLVAVGIGLERRLEKVRELSHELRLKLEEWE